MKVDEDEKGDCSGLITSRDVDFIPQSRWATTRISEVRGEGGGGRGMDEREWNCR